VRGDARELVTAAQLGDQGNALRGILRAHVIASLAPAVQPGKILMAQSILHRAPGPLPLPQQERVVCLGELKVEPIWFRLAVVVASAPMRVPPSAKAGLYVLRVVLPDPTRPHKAVDGALPLSTRAYVQ